MTEDRNTDKRKGAEARAAAGNDIGDRLPPVVVLFVLALVTPLVFYFGPLRLSAYRVTLILVFFPALMALLRGKAGSLRAPDLFIVLMTFWASIALYVNPGATDTIQAVGIMWVETLGGYLIGRVYVRTARQFYALVRILFFVALLFLPFLIFENVTGRDIIIEMADKIGNSFREVYTSPEYHRLGFDRAQGPFSHPIHNGVFFGSLVGLSFFVLGYRHGIVRKLVTMVVTAFAGATALSSGPLAAITSQIYFILWDTVFRKIRSRWIILFGLAVLAYFLVDMLSNRTPFHVFASYFSLNADTAYDRIRIWQYGTKNIWANPLFGLGYNEWVRPDWMSASIDMFWIVGAIQFGVPYWILIFAFFFSIFLPVIFRKFRTDRMQAYQKGYAATVLGLFITGWAVHYWDALYAYFLLIMGSGVWFLDADDRAVDPIVETQDIADHTRSTPYSRFEPREFPDRGAANE